LLYAIMGLGRSRRRVIVPDPGYPIYESLTPVRRSNRVPIGPSGWPTYFCLVSTILASLITPKTRLI